jgi:hypothetical protein
LLSLFTSFPACFYLKEQTRTLHPLIVGARNKDKKGIESGGLVLNAEAVFRCGDFRKEHGSNTKPLSRKLVAICGM